MGRVVGRVGRGRGVVPLLLQLGLELGERLELLGVEVAVVAREAVAGAEARDLSSPGRGGDASSRGATEREDGLEEGAYRWQGGSLGHGCGWGEVGDRGGGEGGRSEGKENRRGEGKAEPSGLSARRSLGGGTRPARSAGCWVLSLPPLSCCKRRQSQWIRPK